MKVKTIRIIFLILTMCVVLAISGGCLAQPMDEIPETLLGTWHGESSVRLPIVFVPEPDNDPSDDLFVSVTINITIHEDGVVTGMIGGAELKNCVLKQNRGELGRQLNVATDYVIIDGYMDGPIVTADEVLAKDLSIPFNVVDGRIEGSLFWRKAGRYPLPLIPHIELVRDQ